MRAGDASDSRSGSWSARAPAAPARPSAATSATAATPPGCASSTRRTRRSSRRMRRAATTSSPAMSSRIEGIGRPRVEPSFLPDVVDRMVVVPDAASVAAARHVSAVLGRRVGPSTGTNLWGAFGLLAEMVARRAQRIGGHAARRQRRPLRRHLLQRRVADQPRARPDRRSPRCSSSSSGPGRWP